MRKGGVCLTEGVKPAGSVRETTRRGRRVVGVQRSHRTVGTDVGRSGGHAMKSKGPLGAGVAVTTDDGGSGGGSSSGGGVGIRRSRNRDMQGERQACGRWW